MYQSAPSIVLHNRDKTEAVILAPGAIKRGYVIVVTLDSFSLLATDLSILLKGFVQKALDQTLAMGMA